MSSQISGLSALVGRSLDVRAILTWHSLDGSGSPISVTPSEFRRQVAWLLAEDVGIVSVDELLQIDDQTDAAALTFDDGFASMLSEVVPVLREHRLPATCFLVTGQAGGDNRWGGQTSPGIPTLPLLGWDDLARLRDAGVTLGGHSRTHPWLPTLGPAELDREILQCADDIKQRLGVQPTGFAYPYGAVDLEVERVVARAYSWACTTELRPLHLDGRTHLLPRLDMWYFGETFRRMGWGSSLFRSWVWARHQGRRLRALLPARHPLDSTTPDGQPTGSDADRR